MTRLSLNDILAKGSPGFRKLNSGHVLPQGAAPVPAVGPDAAPTRTKTTPKTLSGLLGQTESEIQREVIKWWDHTCYSMGCIPQNLFAIPNGGKRRRVEAAIMKGEGVRAGVPDLFLAVPSGCYNGLFIEMKRPNQKPRTSQEFVMKELRKQGYATMVATSCYGAFGASQYITLYLLDNELFHVEHSTFWET